MHAFHYVYVLESVQNLDIHYVGLTNNLRDRLRRHNAGFISHTAKHGPWRIRTAIAFRDRAAAANFERYLKSGSGRSFAKRHL